ncbi:MAG TPA: protease inhibitor I42 family protein [Polyangiaceae bacterium]|nr:protease inhibitor I42 family protein [Polyangiaceae bacterium]
MAVALLACSACKDGSGAPAPASPAGNAGVTAAGQASEAGQAGGETVIVEADDGRSFDVAIGATVTFRLAGRSGTGYAWTPTHVDPAILAQKGERTTEVSSDTPGAPKVDVYRFAAAAAGSTTVDMSLARPFGDSMAARTMHVTVNVH